MDYFSTCDPDGIGPAEYELTIMTDGQLHERLTGRIEENEVEEVFTFDY